MENNSGLTPLGVAVLIKPYEPERRGSVIMIPDNVKERTAIMDARAIVVAVGPHAWYDEPEKRAKPGDKVLVSKFTGFTAKGPADGELYRLVNDRDIFCAITFEEEVNSQPELPFGSYLSTAELAKELAA